MRFGVLAVLGLALLSSLASCQDCPDGSNDDSVYCNNGAQPGDCASDETVCGGVCTNTASDRDNCGACGTTCGDGLVCQAGACVEGCDSGQLRCDGACVDATSDEANCGGCGSASADFVCADDKTCVDGTCACGQGELVCGGFCTNPQTSPMYCGATTTCEGGNAGVICGDNEGCLNGTCTSTKIYRGSLPVTTGRWSFNGQLGLTGANALCAEKWPGSAICTYDKLKAASLKTPAETINAVDFNGAAVTSWWVDDTTVGGGQRCQSNADQVPWSYQTADQGHVGKYADLTAATGAVSAFTLGTLPSCTQNRNVACCSIVTAP